MTLSDPEGYRFIRSKTPTTAPVRRKSARIEKNTPQKSGSIQPKPEGK
jgi:hypothetical protein